MSTAINTGITCVICDVISKRITQTDIVCVTAPLKAAAPTVAYAPGMIFVICPLYRTPRGNQVAISSPMIRPIAAPVRKFGMKLPLGIGSEEQIIEKTN